MKLPMVSSFPCFLTMSLLLLLPLLLLLLLQQVQGSLPPLRFNPSTGQFKILQVADMHYANGASTPCEDVTESQMHTCSDLNTTAFLRRMIAAEKPDLIVFTGDNIFGSDCDDAAASQVAAFAPAVDAGIPWAAILGNHDQEGSLSRRQLMEHIVSMNHSRARVNPYPRYTIDGFGNYNLDVKGVDGSPLANKNVLNLFYLDSGDYSTVANVSGYGWIKPSQQVWFLETSSKLKAEYKSKPAAQNNAAPGLAFFHIPVPEFSYFDESNRVGVRQDPISSSLWNSGFFSSMLDDGDVKAAFVGHDHLNDFCGELEGLSLCYGGGFGYHAYGLAGWSRRARIIVASLGKENDGTWGGVNEIRTWKRLDDNVFSTINQEVLWST